MAAPDDTPPFVLDVDVDVEPWDRPQVPTTAQVVLGLFVMGQLAFLVLANFLGLLEDTRKRLADDYRDKDKLTGWLKGEGHFHDLQTQLTGLCDRYGQIIHSPQSWSLFAPSVATRIDFPALELRWDDEDDLNADELAARTLGPLAGLMATAHLEYTTLWAVALPALPDTPPPVWLLSDNEPQNLRCFFRLGRFRLRRLESNLGVTMIVPPDRTLADVADGWRSDIQDKLRRYWRMHFSYMRRRLRDWQQQNPNLPTPRQVVLWVRLYSIPAPDDAPNPWNWQTHPSRRMARWRPAAKRLDSYLPLEMFNPVTERYEFIWSSDADDEP
jgi:hypothetical protein